MGSLDQAGDYAMTTTIFPSIIAKNQQELDTSLKKLKGVSKIIHLDIVDGKFAPNQSLNFKFKLPKTFSYNVHLMIQEPEMWIKTHPGFQLYFSQFETAKDKENYISWMKKSKKKVCFAINPETTVAQLKPFLSKIDYILVLTVHPGFYGSKYLPPELKKIKQIKNINPKIKIVVDGHMNPKTIKDAVKAGADYIISGSFISRSDDPKKAMRELRKVISPPPSSLQI
ncbi:MAG TPA: hypothetical protein VJI32_06840 [Candidatus Nanoarchaeia archaeon]|nr:hypothetical protein [Candidatus Nanoarchaeia archaeon]